ncbi:MAG: protein kinase domain-containing protein, partial [Acidimicrobiales bacterium]
MSDSGPGAAGGEVDRTLAGRYQLTEFIACGGMAEVWEGRDLRLARLVAIKMPLPHLRGLDQAMTRFRREAVAAAKLSHPNVVAVYDTGTDGADTFIVMERVSGESLAEMLSRQGPLDIEAAVAIGAQVANALDFAHRAGVVHRDIKPANILVTSDGQVKVTDFGIAKAMQDEGLTNTQGVLGTARYASPEQIEGRTPDGRTDVYALGVVLYEMLCGRAPFRADTEIAVAMAHVRDVPVPPSRLRKEVPAWLEAVVLRSLAKDPKDRFESAAALRAVLLDGGNPIETADAGGNGRVIIPPGRGGFVPTSGRGPSTTVLGDGRPPGAALGPLGGAAAPGVQTRFDRPDGLSQGRGSRGGSGGPGVRDGRSPGGPARRGPGRRDWFGRPSPGAGGQRTKARDLVGPRRRLPLVVGVVVL